MSSATQTSLSRIDAAFMATAANQPHGRIVLPETMTPLAGKRLIGRLLKNGLIEPRDFAGADGFTLTPAGYAIIGMTPPAVPAPQVAGDATASKTGSKRNLVLALLVRAEGASLSELIATTGWLPHTTRAALSRLRSSGHLVAKTQREDGATAYRIVPADPTPRRRAARGKARPPIAEAHTVAGAA